VSQCRQDWCSSLWSAHSRSGPRKAATRR
jgi:hypothetical protein